MYKGQVVFKFIKIEDLFEYISDDTLYSYHFVVEGESDEKKKKKNLKVLDHKSYRILNRLIDYL